MSESVPRSRPRIPVVSDPDDAQRELLAKSTVATGSEPPNIFRTLVHHPDLMRRVNALGGLFVVRSQLDPRVRELAILRTSRRRGCEYEWVHHVRLGALAGIAPEEIDRLAAGGPADEWPGPDAAVLGAVDELIDDGELGDAAFGRLVDGLGWSDAQVLEFMTLVGFYSMLAAVVNTVGVEIDGIEAP